MYLYAFFFGIHVVIYCYLEQVQNNIITNNIYIALTKKKEQIQQKTDHNTTV